MRVTLILATLFALALASPAAEADLEKRACRDVKCKCAKGTKQGQYCGSSPHVTDLGSGLWGDIYECNPGGGCCDYGRNSKC